MYIIYGSFGVQRRIIKLKINNTLTFDVYVISNLSLISKVCVELKELRKQSFDVKVRLINRYTYNITMEVSKKQVSKFVRNKWRGMINTWVKVPR